MRKVRSVAILALALILALSGTVLAASVAPVPYEGLLAWPGNTPIDACIAVGCTQSIGATFFQSAASSGQTSGPVTLFWDNDAKTSFSWSSTEPILCVVVMGAGDYVNGFQAHTYKYGGAMGDTGLVAPQGVRVENIFFCKGEQVPEEKEFFGETAWAANGDVPLELRYVRRGNWATYVAYGGEKTTMLFAGQTVPVGSVHFSAVTGGMVTITINLTGEWVFEDGITNVMVQDYATAPSGNPAPGRFEWKTTGSGQSASITVPANNFYGVHVNVGEWRVP